MLLAHSTVSTPRRALFQAQRAAVPRGATVSGPISRIAGTTVASPSGPRHPASDPIRLKPTRHLTVAAAASDPAPASTSSPAPDTDTCGRMEVATLGGGCFWCGEACYNMMRGVQSAISGYAAGHTPNPAYKEVCSGTTGHAEVVQITYDPAILSYREILEIFFTIHDPTTKDRQGHDVGPQYRSIILTHSPQQREVAEQVMEQVRSEGWWSAPLVTQVQPLDVFYPAEDYHQNYFVQNPGQGYCTAVVGPKVAKFRTKFAAKLK